MKFTQFIHKTELYHLSLSLEVYYSLWRRLLKAFWWTVVAYTMVVLIAIYTFQFEDFPGYWGNFTGFTEQQYVSCLPVYY